MLDNYLKPSSRLTARLIYQTYVPNKLDTIHNIPDIVLTVPECLTYKQFYSNSMDWILNHVITNSKTYLKLHKDKLNIKHLPNAEVFNYLGESISLKDTGIKWLVMSYGDNLLFCEEIQWLMRD